MYTIDSKVVNGNNVAGATILVNGVKLKDYKFKTVNFLSGFGKSKVLEKDASDLMERLKSCESLIFKLDVAGKSLTDENAKLKVDKINLESKISTLEIDNNSTNRRLNDANILIEELTNKIESLTTANEICSPVLPEEEKVNYKELYELELEKHKVTLDLLKDAQDKIQALETSENVCEDLASVEDAQPEEKSIVVPEDTKNLLSNFIKSLSKNEKEDLRAAIKKGHENDKRLSSTIKNWESKINDKDLQLESMFKTALARRRGKNVLKSWYERFDNFSK